MANSLTSTILAQKLAGEFENHRQAREQPIWFVSLRLWYRPLPQKIAGNLALFGEQASVQSLDKPYRQRLAVIQSAGDRLTVQYLAFKQPEKFQGAGVNPDKLKTLSSEDWEFLPGCDLTVTEQNGVFIAQPEPGKKCCFEYQGKVCQVVLGFEVSDRQFKSFDRGVDRETGASTWGALMGPYLFDKCQDFSAELPLV